MAATKLEAALRRSAVARGFKPGTPAHKRYVEGTMAKVKTTRKGNS